MLLIFNPIAPVDKNRESIKNQLELVRKDQGKKYQAKEVKLMIPRQTHVEIQNLINQIEKIIINGLLERLY